MSARLSAARPPTLRRRAPRRPRQLLAPRRHDAARRLTAPDRHPRPRATAKNEATTTRLLDRATLGWTLADQEAVDALGPSAWLEAQLDPESIDDLGLEATLRSELPSLSMSPLERLVAYEGDEQQLYYELLAAGLYRAVYSPRQLYERMVIFWSDHFHISIHADESVYLKTTDDLEVIRRHALGNFPDLLRASLRSPAMLAYLTNDSNVAGHPNENYARELMELHTLGVDGGYSERDVKELARCLTGWSFASFGDAERFGRFERVPTQHDTGTKTVLGLQIPASTPATTASMEAEIEAVTRHLVEHPSTARFLATKLLRFFWGEQPTADAVDDIAAVYAATGGQIPAMVRECLRPERLTSATPKLKRPYHLFVSVLRALFAELTDPFPTLGALLDAGHLPFDWGPPNGPPDTAAYWSGLLLPRWNWASRLAFDPAAGIVLPPELESFVTGSATTGSGATDPADWIDVLDLLLTGGHLCRSTRRRLNLFLRAKTGAPTDPRGLLALALTAPELQRY
ncbi:MAG: DUF1800 domain-containing protein [Acidobacteriota bacterium]